MPAASKVIARSPESCWRHFTDAATLIGWVPGLRRAWTVATFADGLPREVAFEFAASRTYSLVYRYDLEARAMWWEPRIGQRDAVRGSARFDAEDGGPDRPTPSPGVSAEPGPATVRWTRVTYTTEEGESRSAAERLVDDPQVLLEAFARWMARTRD